MQSKRRRSTLSTRVSLPLSPSVRRDPGQSSRGPYLAFLTARLGHSGHSSAPRWTRARLDSLQPLPASAAATQNDTVRETQRALALLHLTHFESTLCLPAHVEAAAVALRR